MKKRYQIIILVSVTLIIGFAIGFLVHGRMVSQRINTMKNYYNETGFGREIMRIIQPTEEQRAQIVPIFREYAQKNRDLIETYHEDQGELFKELKEEVDKYLTEEQIKRLDDHRNSRKPRFEDAPPPGPDPRFKHRNRREGGRGLGR